MKDFSLPEIRQYEVPFPPTPQISGAIASKLREVKSRSYLIPLENGESIMVAIASYAGTIKIGMSAFGLSNGSKTMRAVGVNEVYKVINIFLEENEALVWTFDSIAYYKRAKMFRAFNGSSFDMNNFNILFIVSDDCSLPFEQAYGKKVQKNKGYRYCRGNIGQYRFVHLEHKNPIPWTDLEVIANKEYAKGKSCVVFSKETEKRPNEFILWETERAQ